MLFAVHVEVADPVLRPFANRESYERLALCAVDDQRILHDLHVDVTMLRVQGGDVLRQIFDVLVLIERAVAPPEEAFGLRADCRNDLLGGQRLVAEDLNPRNGETPPFVDTKGQRRLFLGYRRVDGDFSEEVALRLVKRVDSRDILRHLGGIDRLADQKINAVFDVAR